MSFSIAAPSFHLRHFPQESEKSASGVLYRPDPLSAPPHSLPKGFLERIYRIIAEHLWFLGVNFRFE
jgi:hypothetical protein